MVLGELIGIIRLLSIRACGRLVVVVNEIWIVSPIADKGKEEVVVGDLLGSPASSGQ